MRAHCHKKFKMSASGNAGFSMIEPLIGAALLGLVAIVGTTLFSTQMQSQKVFDKTSWRNTLRANVKAFMSCGKTIQTAGNGCSTNSYIHIRRSDNSLLAKADGSLAMGPYKLRGRCQERDILFEYKDAAGTANWAPLYDGIPIRCKEPDPMTVTQVTVTKDIAFVADDGARISFDVTTGLWNDLDPFGVSYDSNACQDYIGLIAMYVQPWGFGSPMDAGSLRLQTYNGTIVDWPMGTGFRFNSGCAGPFSWGKLWYNGGSNPKQMPGIWGGQTKLKNFSTGPISGGAVSVQQVGNQVIMTGSGTAIFRPTFNFDVE